MLMRSGKANAWFVCCWMLLLTGFVSEGWGQNHTLFIKTDGSLWAMGRNNFGQLGDGTTTDRNSSVQIESRGVTSFAVGLNHSLYVKDGALYSMGQNTYGQLGDGTTTDRNSSVQIVSDGVSKVAAGIGHSIFIKSDGSLWAMGANNFGQLGDGTMDNSPTPIEIESSEVTAIAAGGQHTLYLKSDGSLHAMGYNADGQLGNGTTTDSSTPIEVEQMDVTSIAAGSIHSLYLKSDGSLWAMGANAYGQLGDGNTTGRSNPIQVVDSNVTSIDAAGNASYFIKNNDSFWAMGDNRYGQLGKNIEVIKSDELLAYFPFDENATDIYQTYFAELTGTPQLVTNEGRKSILFDQENQYISIWMWNRYSLTDFTFTFWAKPTVTHQIDSETTSGTAGTSGQRYVIFPDSGGSNAGVGISLGTNGVSIYEHGSGYMPATCVVSENLSGWNFYSLVVSNNQSTLYLNGSIKRVAQFSGKQLLPSSEISKGYESSDSGFLGYLDEFRIYNQDLNATEILEIFNSSNTFFPITKEIVDANCSSLSSSGNHAHFIKNNGSLWGMGLNQYGQLGDGTDTTRSTPVQIHTGFEMQPKRVSFTVNSGGTVFGDGTYNLNSTINLIASPSLGYLFSGWSGDFSSSDTNASLLVDGDKNITATFSQDTADDDADGLTNYEELVTYLSDTNDSDSDDDTLTDGQEAQIGTDPNVANSALVTFFNDREATARTEGNASGIAYVQNNPSTYGLFSSADLNQSGQLSYNTGFTEGNTSGINYLVNHPGLFGYFTTQDLSDSAELAKAAGSVEALATVQADLAMQNLSYVPYTQEMNLEVPHTHEWYYQPGAGWVWTTPDLFPYLYLSPEGNELPYWIFYDIDRAGPAKFYDYQNQQWKEWLK